MSFRIVKREHDLEPGDVPLGSTRVACDTETTGLDFRRDRLCTCQFCFGDGRAIVVRVDDSKPEAVCRLLADSHITKVFHHAPFDLGFMVKSWRMRPAKIMCTKISSKLLDPEGLRKHNLKALLADRLGVEIDKTESMSNWGADLLTQEQLRYCASDVRYLLELMSVLEGDLRRKGLWELAKACFRHIPTRVRLNLSGYDDIFAY
jgi:ribonuclease D